MTRPTDRATAPQKPFGYASPPEAPDAAQHHASRRSDRDPERLLGDLVTTTSRTFIVGPTGSGKSLAALGLAVGMASGSGFLHWPSHRPARVLLIDGEMPAELIKSRAIDALRRAAAAPKPCHLAIFSQDDAHNFAKRFPALGRMEPLNTEAGRNFVLALIAALGGVDVVIFDSVPSLVAGNQPSGASWSDTMPLVRALTERRIGQIWTDNTGHATDRQYGSSTKALGFESVGMMAALPDGQREPGSVGFTLSFDGAGKAHRRTPENWQDFQTVAIRLANDVWTSGPVLPPRAASSVPQPKCEPDAWQEPIATFLEGKRAVTITQVAREALHLDTAKIGTAEQRRTAAVLTTIGWRVGKRSKAARFWIPSPKH